MRRYPVLVAALVVTLAAWAAGAAKGPTGFLKVDSPGLVLKLDGGKSHIVGKAKEIPVPPLRAVPLPVGSYKVVAATLHAKDKAGNLWRLDTKGKLGKLAAFDIAEGETTTLKGGGPLRIGVRVSVLPGRKVDPRDLAHSSGFGVATVVPPDARIAWVVVRYVGQGGEAYFPCFKVGKNTRPLPTVHILDEDGTGLTQCKYQRGGIRPTFSGTSREREGSLWPVPPGFTRRIGVKVVQDTGPFEIEPEKEPKLHSVAGKGKER